jgi:hypothetical protein
MRSARSPAGIAISTNGSVSAVCNNPVSPSPTPSSSTATMGLAASAICSADCAARLDQASRLKVEGRREESGAGIWHFLSFVASNMETMLLRTHPISDVGRGAGDITNNVQDWCGSVRIGSPGTADCGWSRRPPINPIAPLLISRFISSFETASRGDVRSAKAARARTRLNSLTTRIEEIAMTMSQAAPNHSAAMPCFMTNSGKS